jgi:hypothetical protein
MTIVPVYRTRSREMRTEMLLEILAITVLRHPMTTRRIPMGMKREMLAMSVPMTRKRRNPGPVAAAT